MHLFKAKSFLKNFFNTSPFLSKLRESQLSENLPSSSAENDLATQTFLTTQSQNRNNRKRSFLSHICDQQFVQIQTETSPIEHEIEKYEAMISYRFQQNGALDDPLKFFQLNKENFQILFNISKIIFTCPATSVPAESLFSQAGQIQNDLKIV